MTKKEFKSLCSFHRYSGKNGLNAIYYDWKDGEENSIRYSGFKYMIYGRIGVISKKELFDVFYNWIVNNIETPYYTNIKVAQTDIDRFKVSLTL